MICLWEYKPNMNIYETVWIERRHNKNVAAQENFYVTENQPIFKDFNSEHNNTKYLFRGRKWISLGGNNERYFVDCIALNGKDRRFLTVFILENFAEKLIEKSISIDAQYCEQLQLF